MRLRFYDSRLRQDKKQIRESRRKPVPFFQPSAKEFLISLSSVVWCQCQSTHLNRRALDLMTANSSHITIAFRFAMHWHCFASSQVITLWHDVTPDCRRCATTKMFSP